MKLQSYPNIEKETLKILYNYQITLEYKKSQSNTEDSIKLANSPGQDISLNEKREFEVD